MYTSIRNEKYYLLEKKTLTLDGNSTKIIDAHT
jgi:hypothetical protein